MIDRRTIALSNAPLFRTLKAVRRGLLEFSLPTARILVRPVLWGYLAVRSVQHYLLRVLVCEPLFKAYCSRCGKGVRTGIYVHWVQGSGALEVGDHVLLDGKSSFTFAARYRERPTLRIGDHTGIGHNCSFAVGDSITIGRHCRIASDVMMFDTPGHPSDPQARLAGLASPPEDVRPIVIEDNVWIGRRAIVFPGVHVGEGSVVSAGAVVVNNVPANSVVAGNPARRIATLSSAESADTRESLRVGDGSV